MELSQYKKLKKNNLFISFQINDYYKFIAFVKKMRKVNDEEIRFYPCFLIEKFKGERRVVAYKYHSNCQWTIALDNINTATEKEIKELYKYLKFDKNTNIV